MDTKIISKSAKSPNEIRAFRIVWYSITIYLKWEPRAFWGIIAHLEIQSEGRVPIPITNTGYRSHFCNKVDVEEYGWPMQFINAWLEQESSSSDWKSYLKTKDAQSLF
jgi:hypothetical protein